MGARVMQIRLLGQVEARLDDLPLELGGAKQRAVLAMLGLEANRAVTADRLIEGLWGETPPPSAAKMVQNYVWRLRKALGDEGGAEIVTRGRAYELRIDRELVDVHRLERLLSEARAGANGKPGGAARQALALFSGDPLADVADEPFAVAEIHRLEDLRLSAAELAIDVDLSAGRHQEVVTEVESLLTDNPLRERMHAQRMLALYRCGRQAEALEAYRDARDTLVEQIGIEPGPELQGVHASILCQDPALDVERAADDLAPELDATAAPPLEGRDAELRELRALWRDGGGGLVTIAGAFGTGKTRLAAELAHECRGDGAAVLYASGNGPPEVALAVIARTVAARGPTLLVLDDADRAPVEVRRALYRFQGPALVLATGVQAAALARLEPRASFVLEPLDGDAVHAIAALYAPPGGTIPVEELLATSRGVARRVHEAASEWARREATLRVDDLAGRAAAGRSEARALEHELAGRVVDLQSTRERVRGFGLADELGEEQAVCPYKGLASFDREDAEYFFGREELVAELVAHVAGTPLLAVVGPSGSGKSSAVRAGLLPALAGGVLPHSHNWTQAVIRPGANPLHALQRATRRLAPHQHSVLVVDQFEELFTLCAGEDERAEFAARLSLPAAGRLVVVVVRADFYGRCAAYPALARAVGANHVLVGAMSRDELRRAIERPAQRVGLSVEPELVQALLTDVEGEPGALPLLSTALMELWSERQGRRLSLAAYSRSGGVQGAVARLAEDAFVALDPAQQVAARTLMLRLSDEDEEGTIVRRRIALSEQDAEVAGRLAERRLLTVSDGTVEVAHEALLREWPRLRGWLAEDAQGRRVQRALADAARAWDQDGRDPGSLYRGARLATALDWAATRDQDLDPTERAFLDRSRSAGGRAQRRLRLMLAGAAVVAVAAVVAGVVALDQRDQARDQATATVAQGLGADALATDDPDRALLLARQGFALADTPRSRGDLLATVLKRPALIGVIHGQGAPLKSLALTPDGRTLLILDADSTLRRVDVRTRRETAPAKTVEGEFSQQESSGAGSGLRPGLNPLTDPFGEWLRLSEDGSMLAVGGQHPVLLDLKHDRLVRPFRFFRNMSQLRFAADGSALFAVVRGLDGEASTSIQRIGLPGGNSPDGPWGEEIERPLDPNGGVASVMLMRDGTRLLTVLPGGPTLIRDARTLRPLKRLPIAADQAALSRDDRTLLAGRSDGTVGFVELATGAVRMGAGRHDGAVVAVAISADGRIGISAGEDKRLIVWEAGQGRATEILEGHTGRITGLVLSRDGRTLYSGALDGKVLIWDLAGDRRLGRAFDSGPVNLAGIPHEGPSWPLVTRPVPSYALSPDGRLLASGLDGGTIKLTDVRTLREVSQLPAVPGGPVRGLGFVPGTNVLAVGGDDGYLALIDPRTGRRVSTLPGHEGTLLRPSFSTDGRLMATVSADDRILLWPLRDGRPTGPARRYVMPSNNGIGPTDVSLSPDGRLLAAATRLGVEIGDVATLRRRVRLPEVGKLRAVTSFTPDGRFVVVGSAEGWVRLWSTKTGRPAGPRVDANTGGVQSLSISPDGRLLATGSVDGTIRLFDLDTQQPLGAPLPGLPNRSLAPLFAPDSATLFALTTTGRAYRWNLDPPAWARHACVVAGRRLTRVEWFDKLPGREYAPAC